MEIDESACKDFMQAPPVLEQSNPVTAQLDLPMLKGVCVWEQGGSASLPEKNQAGLTPACGVGWLVHLAKCSAAFLMSGPLSHCVVRGMSCTWAWLTSLHLRGERAKHEPTLSLWIAIVARVSLESGFSPALLRNDSG